MIILVIGGSGSGKSEFAEDIATTLSTKLLYIATMEPFGNEALSRIERHTQMRKDKGFLSVDCYKDIDKVVGKNRYGTILLECMSNLLANEMFEENANAKTIEEKILKGIRRVKENADNLIIVSNDISMDVNDYTEKTMGYVEKLGQINNELAEIADVVVEVVCSIPIYHKGGKLW